MPAGPQRVKWVFKIVPVAHGYDVYSEVPTLAFFGHAKSLEEAKGIASRQPTTAESARMLIASL